MGPEGGVAHLPTVLLADLPRASLHQPARCIFPDGLESWDTAHACFVSYVMSRVAHDKQLLRAKSQLALTSSDVINTRKKSLETGFDPAALIAKKPTSKSGKKLGKLMSAKNMGSIVPATPVQESPEKYTDSGDTTQVVPMSAREESSFNLQDVEAS